MAGCFAFLLGCFFWLHLLRWY